MTKEKMYTAKEMAEFIEDMVEDGVLSHNGKWINNKVPLWKDVIKPCKLCGFCPYGQLVEEYPLPPMTRAEMVDHIEYMKKALSEGVFDEENKENGLPLMTRKDVEEEIAEFDPEDYPEEKDEAMERMSCSVFGHCCPVFYQMELFAEEDEATEEEMGACDKEILERIERMCKECNEKDDE
jgi:hypothetical protein